jgi:hypothetical protein
MRAHHNKVFSTATPRKLGSRKAILRACHSSTTPGGRHPDLRGKRRIVAIYRADHRALASRFGLRLSSLLPELLLRGASMHGEAGCMICSQPRLLKALFPVAAGFELKLYECAKCASSLWLVTRVSALRVHKGRLGPRFTTIDAALKAASRAEGVPTLSGRRQRRGDIHDM